jgi:hypothetical protein
MVIKMGKAGLNGSNGESDIKSCLASNYVYEQELPRKSIVIYNQPTQIIG